MSRVPHISNAIKAIGYDIKDITTPEEIDSAKMIIFPGVGSFGQAILVRLSVPISTIQLFLSCPTFLYIYRRVFVKKDGSSLCRGISRPTDPSSASV